MIMGEAVKGGRIGVIFLTCRCKVKQRMQEPPPSLGHLPPDGRRKKQEENDWNRNWGGHTGPPR
jgi:hypothetical protein